MSGSTSVISKVKGAVQVHEGDDRALYSHTQRANSRKKTCMIACVITINAKKLYSNESGSITQESGDINKTNNIIMATIEQPPSCSH